jgi:hypothetical protein
VGPQQQGKKPMKFVATICCALACATPAVASTVYSIDISPAFGGAGTTTFTGTITTDGTLGALAEVESWTLIASLCNSICAFGYGLPHVFTYDASNSYFTWTPGSLIATPTNITFNYGPFFTNSFGMGVSGGFSYDGISYGPNNSTSGVIRSYSGLYYDYSPSHEIASAVVPAPGPLVGAGLPGLLALLGMSGWAWRRRR